MAMMLQDFIHRIEEGAWSHHLKKILFGAVILALLVLYDVRAYRNFSNPEAMDAAQLARHIAEGRGYTTDFVRPFSMFLVQRHRVDANPLIQQNHPDLANPPVYPFLLAGILKVAPLDYQASSRTFKRFAPEVLIAVFNQGLFLVLVFSVYRLAQRLFDRAVAWMSVLVILGTNLFWQFSVSGLSTVLLMLIFVGLIWCLVLMEPSAPGEPGENKRLVPLAALSGLIVGLGVLTRYSFGWLMVPVLIYLAVMFGQKRAILCLAALGAFLIALAPWMARNYTLSGTAFGTAGFALLETTAAFPSDTLQRSLKPDLNKASVALISRKFLLNAKEMLRNDLSRLGGNWISAFFLVGLIVPFKSATLGRLRLFLLLCGLVFFAVQALGRTYLSNEVPEINSENLLVILAPLVFVYGVSLYFILLDHLVVPFFQMRYLVNGIFCLLLSLPLLLALPPRPNPLAYPPYWPPIIQTSAGWLKEKELMMSDIPWAVAWYGRRQCAWLTSNYKKDFFEIHDYLKPVHALYLTRRTTDKPFFSDWMHGEPGNWERSFLLETLFKENPPAGFPLRFAAEQLWPEQLFLTDFERWKKFGN